jgi:dienelactone hydrolase
VGVKVVALGLVAVLAVGAAACGTEHGAAADHPPVDTQPIGTRPTEAAPPTTDGSFAAGPRSLVRSEGTFVDRSRASVARPPLAATSERVLRTTIVRPTSQDGPWPLVVFGHGFAASAATYATLLEAIAGAGFVVAAPEFPGSSSALQGRPDETDLAEEPCDLRFVAQRVEAASASDGELSGMIRPGPVALVGQSDGATAAAFAALVPRSCPSPPIAAVVAFSANPVPTADLGPTPSADPPALLTVTGTADAVNPPTHTRALYLQWPGPAWLLSSAGDGHLGPATDSPRHLQIATVVIDFLEAHLTGDAAAAARLDEAAATDGLTLEQR